VLITPPEKGELQFYGDGSFVYRPKLAFSGSDHFTFRATDGAALSPLATVTLLVGSDLPALTPFTYVAGIATFKSDYWQYRLEINVVTNRSRVIAGRYTVYDTARHRMIIGDRVLSVVATPGHVRIFGAGFRAHYPGLRPCVIDLDTRGGVATAVRVETADAGPIGPAPISVGRINVR
jgi:hypothetical protein